MSVITRENYRWNRLDFLRKIVNTRLSKGLEIGAFDFPVVTQQEGLCKFADYQSRQKLAKKFGVPNSNIVHVDYLVERERLVHEQIEEKFDYLVLCHVLEHIPNPIGYLQDLEKLLAPDGIIFLAIPDKRRTPDQSRKSTTIFDILERYFLKATSPALSQIMSFSNAWVDEKHKLFKGAPQAFYKWATDEYETKKADIHCNVWRDDVFFEQFTYLAEANLLSDLIVVAKEENKPEYNEFYVGFSRR